jgi:hypothetical protein
MVIIKKPTKARGASLRRMLEEPATEWSEYA